MPIGIVLSGGGSKGDFEIGALRAMYNRGIRPDVLAGTSVGSINAVKLAEDGTSDGPLSELEALWFGLVNDADMYVEDPNFAKVEQVTKNFLRYRLFSTGFALFIITPSGLLDVISDIADAIKLGVDLKNLIDGISAFVNAGSKSLYLLDPIRQKLAANVDPNLVAGSGVVLRMATVSLESGKVRYIDQMGRFIDDGTTVDLVQAAIASASIPGFFAPQPLGSENFVDGGIRDVLPIQAALDAGADQVYAITASRAGVDPASSFDKKTIMDIALRGAAEIMSDQIQSFETNPPVQPWPSNVMIIQPDFTVHDSFTIDPGLIRINSGYGYMRAAELVDFARSTNFLDLIKLAILGGLSTAIAALRLQIWTDEHSAAGQRTPLGKVTDPQLTLLPSPEAFLGVREQKIQLKNLLEERASIYGTPPRIFVSPSTIDFGTIPVCAQRTQFITVRNMADGGMPTDFSALWLQFEAHPWINGAAWSPWSEFVSRAGTVPAATPPPPAILLDDLQLGTAIPAGPFSFGSISSLSVAPGETATIAVTMGGPQAQIGPAQTTLTIFSNDPSNPAVSVQLTGTFAQAPPILEAPATMDFGTRPLGQGSVQIAIIRNRGCGNLNITQLNITEADNPKVFSVAGPAVPFSVPSGGHAQIRVSFTPRTDTIYDGSLTIVSSNGQPQSATISLLGVSLAIINRRSVTNGTTTSMARALATVRGGVQKPVSAVPGVGTATAVVAGKPANQRNKATGAKRPSKQSKLKR